MTEFQRPILTPPNGSKRVLLHSCCAPCSGEVMEAMTASGIDYTIFFYNPNIHPEREYLLRKDENVRFAEKNNIPFVDADYDKACGAHIFFDDQEKHVLGASVVVPAGHVPGPHRADEPVIPAA